MRLHFKACILATFAAAAACGAQPDGTESTGRTQEAIGPYGITSYSPQTGWIGETVTIEGGGFTTDGTTQVLFSTDSGGAPFTNTVCSTSGSCTFTVPLFSGTPQYTPTFSVYVGGTKLASPTETFKLQAPQITGVSPTTVPSSGGTISITGNGLYDGTYYGTPLEAPYNQPILVSFSEEESGDNGIADLTFDASVVSCNFVGTECTVTLPPMAAYVDVAEPLWITVYSSSEGASNTWQTPIPDVTSPAPPCQKTPCGEYECGGARPDGCGGEVNCGYVCPSGEACTGSVCQVASCPAHRVCPKGSSWSGPPDCVCDGIVNE